MAVRIAYGHGTPSWTDLDAADLDGACAFYGAVFDWSFQERPRDRRAPYVTCLRVGRAVAGMTQRRPGRSPVGATSWWNTYVTVDDVDAAVAATRPAGGSVVARPSPVRDAGTMALIADPTGASLRLWQARRHIGAALVDEHGAMCWHELATDDVEAAAAFLRALFGWSTERIDLGDADPYTVFTVGGRRVAGATRRPAVDGVASHWTIAFAIDDCDTTLDDVAANGGSVLAGPLDTALGRRGTCIDPYGAAFQVIQPAAPADPPLAG